MSTAKLPVFPPSLPLESGASTETGSVRALTLDAEALARELHAAVEGEVRFDNGSRALYSTDGSNYRQIPIGVVVPKHKEDVIAAVALCSKFGAPVLARGGGTSLAGQCCNVAVVLDMSKYMNRILALEPEKRQAVVQPGLILDHLRNAAEKHHLTFAPDPSTHTHCTLGGMIGNNSCGVHSVMGGKTDDNVLELEVLLYDGTVLRLGRTPDAELERIIAGGGRRGEIYRRLRELRDRYADDIRTRYPKIPRRVSGYNLPELLPEKGFDVAKALVGSESTCALVLEATVRLVPSPPKRSLLVLGYKDVYEAGDHVPEVLASQPIGLEAIDKELVENIQKKHLHEEYLKLLPKGEGWLLVEYGGETKEDADAQAERLMAKLKAKSDAPSMKLYDKKDEEEKVWKVRESGLGATAIVPGQPRTWEGWEDAAVPPDRVGDYLRKFRELLKKHKYTGALYGHFGQGCIHTRINFDLQSADGIANYRSFVTEAAQLVVSFGGSLSGEHGDGQSRGELLPLMFGAELTQAFAEFKSIWDPDWKLNPGKKVRPYKLDQNLRLGADYAPWEPKTHFHFVDDDNSFALAALRCVGVGNCRRTEGGTMCPSFMVTREEAHSTRGRAHILFEMLQGDVIRDGWRSHEVKEALDLCLSCKGCKGECPVNVDIATYKAEFLSHYWARRLRPRYAYAFGLINVWSQMAALMPGVVNLAATTPGTRALMKFAAGMPQQRDIPQFAPQTFKSWWRKRAPRNGSKPEVVLFADTFNNHFHPDIAQAAVEVLEAAGYQVRVPLAPLCCGRPLYDYGMLDMAKTYLRSVASALAEPLRAGTKIIVLEPSCASVFRDELKNILPHDVDGQRLTQQTMLLSEFLEKEAKWQPPRLDRRAIVHGHCHHKALFKMNDEQSLLKKMGLEVEMPDSGCCGMAGSFGFEQEKYDVSLAIGERVLLPAVRKASPATLIVADGFSCQEQIAQETDRHALHLAQVLKLALETERPAEPEPFPERRFIAPRERALRASKTRAAVALGGLALAAGAFAALWWGRRR